MFFVLFNLFGSLILLPHLRADSHGIDVNPLRYGLSAGRRATPLYMPSPACSYVRMNPKILVVFGIIVTVFSIYIMSEFSLFADFDTIVLPRTVMGIGMAFVIIPLTTLTLSTIGKEEMENATSHIQLHAKSLGGSVGVAPCNHHMSQRRTQFHQAQLTGHLAPSTFLTASVRSKRHRRCSTGGAKMARRNRAVKL